MRRVATRAAAVLVAVLSLGVAVGIRPAAAAGYVPSDETRVRTLLNATRSSKGLARLASNDHLVGMARRQADKMAAKGSIFHNQALGAEMTSSGLDWDKAGENVGMGPDVDTVEDAFIASPHHYDNIVDRKYDTVGIGVVDGVDGRRYVVQVFADLRAPTVPAPTVAAAQPVTSTPSTTAEPQAQTQASTPPATPVATSTPASAPAPAAETKAPSPVPNVVIGGVVEPLDLSR